MTVTGGIILTIWVSQFPILSVQILVFNTEHLLRILCMLIYNSFSIENNSFVRLIAIFAYEQERTKSVDIKAGKIRMSEY